MATRTFTLTTPNAEKTQTFLRGVKRLYNYQETIDGEANPQSLADFAYELLEKHLNELPKNIYKAQVEYEAREAVKTQAETDADEFTVTSA